MGKQKINHLLQTQIVLKVFTKLEHVLLINLTCYDSNLTSIKVTGTKLCQKSKIKHTSCLEKCSRMTWLFVQNSFRDDVPSHCEHTKKFNSTND
jgi:hypothetical protein